MSVLGIVNELRDLHQLIAFRVRLAEAVVVRIVVVQVQQELIGQFFQPAGEVVDVGETTELNLNRFGHRMIGGNCSWRVVVVAVVDVVCVVVIAVMRDNVCRILVHDIVVIAANHVTMRVSDNVIVMVNVVARVVMVVVRTV